MYGMPDFAKIKLVIFKDKWFEKLKDYFSLIGEGALDLGVTLIVMIMVERFRGEAGLGTFTYLLSILVFAGMFSEFGISRHLEREVASSLDNDAGDNSQAKVIRDALNSVLIVSVVFSGVFLAAALSTASLTSVEENAVAYLIIALTIPLRNFNLIRVAILKGRGNFVTASTLRMWKRIFLFIAIFLFLVWRIPASFLIGGYLVSEFGMHLRSRKDISLPRFKKITRKGSNILSTLNQSRRYILTDDALDVVLYMDFLILGIFVSSSDLGLYAEASILARLFLLVPACVRPVFRKKYCALAAECRTEPMAVSVHMSTAFFFFLNSVLSIYFLTYFPGLLEGLYHVHGKSMVPFYIFAEIVPGLLFFATVTPLEPLYEAEDKVGLLQRTDLRVASLNVVLNLFFVPFAGFYGAAFATSASMFVYFILFGKHLDSALRIDKMKYPSPLVKKKQQKKIFGVEIFI